jgi:hypothetical protein
MVLVLKIVTGEEVVAQIESEDEDTYKLKRPAYIQFVPSRSNPEQPMLALAPYAVYVEDYILTIPKKSVIWTAKPVKELYNQYNNIFGNGIVLS